jgi:vanillate O-demethylase ferredoxin subunit
MSNFPLRVIARRMLTDKIVLLELAHPDGAALSPFHAGAHLPVTTGQWLRHYSLCNDPADNTRYAIAIQRCANGRGGSRAFCDDLDVGHIVTTRAPQNHFALHDSVHRAVLVAGGIGITPMLSMGHELAARGLNFELHYAVRDQSCVAFGALLSRLPFAGHSHIHTDDQSPNGRLDIDGVLFPLSRESHVYVCGPSGMIDAVVETAARLGWPNEQLHWERFSGSQPAAAARNTAFEVVIASTGAVIPVGAEESITGALARVGVAVPVSCEQGVCGSCETRIISGLPEHRDLIFSEEERACNNVFTPCCSRSLSARLVLDL